MGLQTNKYHWAPPLRRSSQQNYFVSICWWHFFLALYLNSWLNHHVVLHFILPISTIQLLLSLHRLGRFSPSPVNHTHIYFCCFNRHFCWVNLHQTLVFFGWIPTSFDKPWSFFRHNFQVDHEHNITGLALQELFGSHVAALRLRHLGLRLLRLRLQHRTPQRGELLRVHWGARWARWG